MHWFACQKALDGFTQLIMLMLVDAQIGVHQLLVPINSEEVFQKDTHQLLRLALREGRCQHLGEMAFRLLQIKTYHGAKLGKNP